MAAKWAVDRRPNLADRGKADTKCHLVIDRRGVASRQRLGRRRWVVVYFN